MAVVKADGYGHGLVPSARAALAGGAAWLGVAFLEEALALRAAGVDAPLLAWLCVAAGGPGRRPSPRTSTSASTTLAELGRRRRRRRAPPAGAARVHLKVDTGLSRGGSHAGGLAGAVRGGRPQPTASRSVGVWSHFAFADGGPDHPVNTAQVEVFAEALEVAERAGAAPGGAPPGQLRRHPHRARHALRPGPPGRRALRPVAGAAARRPRRLRAAAGDDAAPAPWRWSSGCRPAPG